MKKIIIGLLSILCIAMLCACSSGGGTDEGGTVEFKSFTISERGMTAQIYGYEGIRTENGMHLEYFVSYSMWDDEANEYKEYRDVIHAIDGGDELYEKVGSIMKQCKVDKWDGFQGKNPAGVLDGSSMSFKMELPDGTIATASGTNNFPKGYGDFQDALYELVLTEPVTTTAFDHGDYVATLPESWIGTVSIKHGETYTAFYMTKKDGDKYTFFIIDDDTYDYSSESYSGRVTVGKITDGDEIRYITARDQYSLDYLSDDQFGEAEKAIAESYATDKENIIASIQPAGGYKWVTE